MFIELKFVKYFKSISFDRSLTGSTGGVRGQFSVDYWNIASIQEDFSTLSPPLQPTLVQSATSKFNVSPDPHLMLDP